jgi:hypothetical protein
MSSKWYFWAVAAALIVAALYLGVDLNAVGRSLLWVKEFMP